MQQSSNKLFTITGFFLATAALSLTAACSSDDTQDPMGAAGSAGAKSTAGASNNAGSNNGAAGSGPALDNVFGGVVLTFAPPTDAEEGHASLLGRFFDAVTPDPFPLALSEELGDCRLLVPNLPFCSESCAPDVCTDDDVCTPYPNPQSVGTLSVSGLGAAMMIEPKSSMLIYQPASLAYPPCAAGDAVTVKAPGISLETTCIAQLELTGPDPIPVKSGESVRVAWVPQSGAATRIRIGLDVSHHGGKKGQIDCDVADTGSFEIPASLVTKLIDLGLAGFPTINVNRVAVGLNPATPNLSLLISSDITRAVDTGVVSCLDDSDCEEPQTCLDVGICGE
jgi:hypothetical protein